MHQICGVEMLEMEIRRVFRIMRRQLWYFAVPRASPSDRPFSDSSSALLYQRLYILGSRLRPRRYSTSIWE
jgi:hypothetical protein